MSVSSDKMTSTPATSSPAGRPRSVALRRFAIFWDQLASRTRNVLLVCAAALAIGLIYSYIWHPAARGRVVNAERIPALEAQLATMRAQYAEMKRINAVPPAALSSTASATNAAGGRAAADLAGLQSIFGASAKITIDETRAFRISVASTGYISFLDRLDQALSRYRLNVSSLNLIALNADMATPIADAKKTESALAPALVSVDIVLSAAPTAAPNVSSATKP